MRKRLTITAVVLATTILHAHAASTLTLRSATITKQATMPVEFTCNGANISPSVEWSGLPANTATLALIMSDPDAPAGTFYHWVVYDIPKTVTGFPAGMQELPSQSVAGKNTWEKMQYRGPCPPKGSTHHYVFTLYALDSKLNLPQGATGPDVIQAMQDHILATSELTTTYKN